MASKKEFIVCDDCGGTDVVGKIEVTWDEDAHKWVIDDDATPEEYTCQDCCCDVDVEQMNSADLSCEQRRREEEDDGAPLDGIEYDEDGDLSDEANNTNRVRHDAAVEKCVDAKPDPEESNEDVCHCEECVLYRKQKAWVEDDTEFDFDAIFLDADDNEVDPLDEHGDAPAEEEVDSEFKPFQLGSLPS